ncbi:MAG: SpoIIE family protein phosphatase [Desulfatibacillum sp.]|nr:SpoIIE family protein phosphatase [Desulfatibacillum sp.]
MKVLVADDDRTVRIALKTLLTKWGYEVITVEDGIQAWETLQEPGAPRLAILDWIMPGIEGPALCERIRKSSLASYTYLILLTAKSRKTELMEGLESGADDFISKPFNAGELKARIKAAERILTLEKELKVKNQELSQSNINLSRSNDIITQDLQVAASVQQSLLPAQTGQVNGFRFGSLFMPCAIVGGDMFNFFRIGDHHIAFFILDISGHGVPAAMLSVTVSKTLTSLIWEEAMVHGISKNGSGTVLSPEDMVAKLNRLFQTSDTLQAYFTMILGIIDCRTGHTTLTQAGHPHPIWAPANGDLKTIGNGGFPVGLLENATYSRHEFTMNPGDRLFLYSDGITECRNCQDSEFSQERLMRLLDKNRATDLEGVMRKTAEELYRFRGDHTFSDDISFIALQRD